MLASVLLAVLSLALAGCGNDNPQDNGGTIRVDLANLQQQLGGDGYSSQATGLEGTSATTAVRSLVIGAVVITFTNTPLSSDTNLNSSDQDKLTTDILNSINYFSIVDLPAAADFVEFKVPPPGAGKWQVAAVGTRDRIVAFDDLDSNDTAIYYGFESQFRTTSGSSGPTVELEMKRACFIDNPPKGCAAYDEDRQAVVTSTVTILDVLAKPSTDSGNGLRVGGITFPIVVQESTLSVSAALSQLQTFQPAVGETVTVVTTHPNAPGQSACSSLVYVTGVTSLTDSCIGTFVSEYK